MKNIVIVVDMQNGFASIPQTKALSEKIAQLLDMKLFDAVVATRFFNAPNSIYEKLFGWKGLETPEEQAIPESILKHADFVEDKFIYNCVGASFIQRLCQLNDGVYPEKIFIVGADTECCVLMTATTLFEANIRPVVLTSYCNSNGGDASHKAGLLALKRLIGEAQLISSEPKYKEDLDKM